MAIEQEIISTITDLAKRLNLADWGIAPADEMVNEADRLALWISNGYHADMQWIAENTALRQNPKLLVPGTQSILVFTINYAQQPVQPPHLPRIARYAYGRDYHKVLRNKLKKIGSVLNQRFGISGRCFVDSAPVFERELAVKAGLGFIGKNCLLIHRNAGSWFLLGSIFIDIPLPPAQKLQPHSCGGCTRCIDACPTGALAAPYTLDARKCISYLTIEKRGDLEPPEAKMLGNHLFGCDICQEVCPWNRFAIPTKEPDFRPRPWIMNLDARQWQDVSDEDFNRHMAGSAIMRPKAEGIRRNAEAVLENEKRK